MSKFFTQTSFDTDKTTIKLRKDVTSHIIDYVWYRDLHLIETSYQPKGEILHPYLPSATHPSDHFMLTARFEL